MMSSEKGIEKSGYLDVKQPSTTKGRKLKTWKRRWVVVHQMTDLASKKYNAKIDIYHDQDAVGKNTGDKMTFVLENITAVQLSKSKTHPHAFEVVESEPVLVFCAASEQETATWMSIYRRIFRHDELAECDIFGVHVIGNPHTQRLNLDEKVLLGINTSYIMLLSHDYTPLVEWRLSTVKRFYTIENTKDAGKRVLILECGANSSTGEGMFCFSTPEWELILKTIRENISMAIAERQRQKSHTDARERSGSSCNSEYQFSNLLANSDNPSGTLRLRAVRSISEMSSASNISASDSLNTPPLSPVLSTPGKLNTLPTTSTPDPKRSTRSTSLTVDSSVTPYPVFSMEDGYSRIKCTDDPNCLNVKPRSGSISSTNSVSSNRSRMSSSRESDVTENKPDAPEKKTDGSPLRTVSNSFDSGFSNGSYEEAKRKGSDVDEAIMEESPEDKMDPSNIYQELDYTEVLRRRLSDKTDECTSRRRSTGDVTKEPDYEELESRKKDQGIFGDNNLPKVQLTADTPPALPDRPASLRSSMNSKTKSNWKKRLSGLSFLGGKSGHSPNTSPDRSESPAPCQKSQLPSSDIVLDSVNATLAKFYQEDEPKDSETELVKSDHFYQSIPDVVQEISKPTRSSSDAVIEYNSSDILLLDFGDDDLKDSNTPTESPIPPSTSPMNIPSINVEPTISNNLNTTLAKSNEASSPLIDFFFKDDGFERLRAQTVSGSPLSATPRRVQLVPEQPLIDFSSSESLVVTVTPAPKGEGYYMEMNNGLPRAESVEYIPPSEIKEVITNANLLQLT
ncbi:uncharacterized protein LOC126816441 [Patella vulgata]|uniref:uncharacterized protein LOC126816441 n=1 Tax=Patella vulgata TaxID=6465 RepID=UPI00217FEB04|nr:uncharacterized protein LOC126816441 [Patella vulgata]